MIVDDIPCITLGHGILKDPIASHPYFGRQEVLFDLRLCHGWSEGHIVLGQDAIMRNDDTGVVRGFDITKEVVSKRK